LVLRVLVIDSELGIPDVVTERERWLGTRDGTTWSRDDHPYTDNTLLDSLNTPPPADRTRTHARAY
jgi:hypothetical protein